MSHIGRTPHVHKLNRLLPVIIGLFGLLLTVSGCRMFGGLSEQDELKLSVYIQQAVAYYENRRFPAAQQQAQQALKIENNNDVANLILGWSLVQQRSSPKLERAREIFEEMLDRGNVNFRTNYGLALTHYQLAVSELGRGDQLKRWRTNRAAREAAARERGIAPPTDVELEEMIADAELAYEDNLSRAVEQLETVLKINPGYPEGLVSLGQIHLLQENHDSALVNFEEYLRYAELTREKSLDPNKHIVRGMSPNEMDFINEIIEQKIASNIKKDITVRIEAANIHFHKGNYEAAVAHLTKAIELDPEALLPYLNRGECFGEMGDYPSAVRDIEFFVKKSDRDYDNVMERATRLLDRFADATNTQ